MNIKKAAAMFDLSVDTLRYYERIGVIPPVKRNKSGYRDYKVRNLNWIYLAKNLRNAGLPVEALIEFVHLAQMPDNPKVNEAKKQILYEQLEELDQKIAEMQAVREILTYKIDTFDEHLTKFRSGELTDDNVEKLWERKNKITLALKQTPGFRMKLRMIRGGKYCYQKYVITCELLVRNI